MHLVTRTIQQSVRDGRINISPYRKGPDGGVHAEVYKVLCEAFNSFVRINQVNGQAVTRNILIPKVNVATAFGSETVRTTKNLLQRL